MKYHFTYYSGKPRLPIMLFLSFFISSLTLKAQTEIETAKRYLTDNTTKHQLISSDIDEMVVSSAYLSPTTGWYHVYFNQTYQSIEVYNGMLNLTLKNGQVVYVANNFVQNIAQKATINLKAISLTPTQALSKALMKVGLTSSNLQEIEVKQLNGIATQMAFKDANISNNPIEVKLYWLPDDKQENKGTKPKLTLTWNVKFLSKNQQNGWNIHVDAISGEILRQNDDVIHCNFGTSEHLEPHDCLEHHRLTNDEKPRPSVAENTYRVFDYPLESPNHGTRTGVISPYNRFFPALSGPGTTNGWHNDGSTDYTTTRGNNVWAVEDTNADDATGASPTSATLEFDYAYTKGVSTASGNQNAAITNLFYWNNVIHDILWRYGFDEPSGNFQNNNQQRGGLGNDYVFADAQDGEGVNNANFYPPADGINGRMQMFLWSNTGSPSFQPDGDFDNGIIAHEYGHGWSIRLTGGPANSNCLDNAEQGGEGWSDYLALMLTTNWATLTPTVANANIPRGIGTYVLGQTTSGAGIRPYRYSYDMENINAPVTYAKVGDSNFSQPHGIGSIWATMLWDMTWEIILQDNQIVSNIYDTPAIITDLRGNTAALKLVNEGLRLQPCSPSFVDARNAILKADSLLFGMRYRCAIGRAFARRGLGINASTGVSANDRIITEDFTPIGNIPLTSAKSISICTNTTFNYTATSSTNGVSFSWTRPAVVGISNATNSGNTPNISEILVNTTNVPIVVKYYFTLSPSVCPLAPQLVSVTVNPSVVPTTSSYAICQNGIVPNGQGLVVPAVSSSLVDGSIVIGATYRRGGGDNVTTYVTESAGTSVYYKTYTFVAQANGAATFEITQALLSGSSNTDDTYMTLYQTSFNATSPATNFLRGDDDSGIGLLSKFTHTLVQGTTYIIVVSTYTNLKTGSFRLQTSIPIFSGINSWFKDATGGVSLFNGEVFNPVGLAGSGIGNSATAGTSTFYVTNNLYGACRVPVTFTINSLPTISAGLATNPSLCNTNSGTIAFTSTNLSNGSYAIAYTGEGSPKNVNVFNNTFSLSGLRAGTYSNFSVSQLGCAGNHISAKTLIDSLPTDVSNVTVCNNTIASLSANCGNNSVKWYDSTGTILQHIGSSFITNALTTDTTFKVRCENAHCQSAFMNVLITVNIASIPVIQADTTILIGSSISLKSTGCTGNNNVLKWYNSSDNSLITMPISPSMTTQYYAKCEKIQNSFVCLSDKSNVVTVNVFSLIKSIISGDWENPLTWDMGRVPQTGDIVIIDQNHTVTINGIADAKSIEYKNAAKLVFNTLNSKLNVGL
ncbi:M36 family metallopeptidase [Arcicella sp. LKC2W]|uniref:M36 family metallopeptidase n=1 Tax=Arcicella sp. LKC2W TaxID=2984198 RepID=UPI002B2106FB|nr:M36 family metallopeptidase [Arcicella sp. LKC2W]MEA5459675.1 M36 family metallopeptidase [Arcicella sp. LKC2W]